VSVLAFLPFFELVRWCLSSAAK